MTTAEAEAPGATKLTREWSVMKQPEMRIKREAAGLSRSHVALTLGVSVGAVQNWESGNSTPTAEVQQQMLNLFNNPPTVEAAATEGATVVPTNGTNGSHADGTEPASTPPKKARKKRVAKAKPAAKVKAPKVKAARPAKKTKGRAPKAVPSNPLAKALADGTPARAVPFTRPDGDTLATATAAVVSALVTVGKVKASDVADTIRVVRAALLQ